MNNLENVLILKYGGIHIKPENKGTFTDYCGGKVTQECIQRGKHSSDPITRKRATFAANARTWKHKNGGDIMIPDIIKFFNGGGIPMFQESGKLGWDNPEPHTIPAHSARNGVFQQNWGAIQTDENGLQYRDVRYNRWSQGTGDQNYSTSIERVYNPNQKGYKRALKKGLIPYMTSSEETTWGETGNRNNYGYTVEQADSLHNAFDEHFGRITNGAIGEPDKDNWEVIYNTYYQDRPY